VLQYVHDKNGLKGKYMKKLLVLLIAAAIAISTPVVALADTARTNDNLRIRKSPSIKGEIVTVVPKGTELEVIGDADDGWVKISYKSKECYVKSEYLTVAPAENEGVTAETKTESVGTESAVQTAAGGAAVTFDPSWKYADYSAIKSGTAVLYRATDNRKNKVIGVNAGHGTSGGGSVKTWCHPDKTPKVTGGTTSKGATKATAVSGGMNFKDGTSEAKVNLREAQILRDLLLANGYDVLMIRDGDDVQLDNVARTVMCNNLADCHIAIHWDGDALNYDKGCFYSSVPDGIKYLETVAPTWEKSEKLGACLITGLSAEGNKINGNGYMDIDLTQTSYSTVPSVDIELGNQCSDHSDAKLTQLAKGMLAGINAYFGY